MATRVWLDGEVRDERMALVPVFDRGFLYGDSVYEVTRTAGGRPVDLGPHLDRLRRSAAAIEIGEVPHDVIRAAIDETLAAAQNPESYVRIVLTRGGGEIGLDPALADRPRLIVIVRDLKLPDPSCYTDGVGVQVVNVRWNLRRAVDPAVKSGNYLTNVMALSEAKRSGAYEAVMTNADGHVAEGSTSNIFSVTEGVVTTPPVGDGLLDGITRRRVLELAAAAGVPVKERHLSPTELRQGDEAFLTSSTRGVVPITRVDGRPVGDGKPGPVTQRLMDLYWDFLQRVSNGEL